MKDNSIVYVKAYTEVNCFLKYLPQSYIDKLPKKLIKLIESKYDEQYKIDIDNKKSLLKQNYSKKTKDLLAVIKYKYWSTNEEKKQLTSLLYENEKKYQKELSEKYNPNNIFNKQATKIETPQNTKNSTEMVVYKENIFTRIKKMILNLFK